MKEILGILGTGIVSVIVIGGAVAGLNYFGYLSAAFYAPKYEEIRRETMLESRTYHEGTLRELYRLKRQYDTAIDESAKQTIAAAARHEFQIFPSERLPGDLYAWMQQIQ
jgi:cytochrome c556